MPGKYTSKLQGKRVLIIGGTSGIGFGVAEGALEYGASVIIASSRQTSIDDAVGRLTKSYPDLASNLSSHIVDLKSDDAERNIITLLDFATSNKTTLLDHVVDTSGDSLPLKPLADVDLQYILDSQRVRWIGSIYLAKALQSGYIKHSNESSFTLTGGVNSYVPGQNWFLPAGVGSGKDGLMRGLAVDLRPVRVNLVAPGAIHTELFERTFKDPEMLKRVLDGFRENTLTGEVGRPEDVAEAYLYCMKDRFVTGQVILSEGGLLLAPGTKR